MNIQKVLLIIILTELHRSPRHSFSGLSKMFNLKLEPLNYAFLLYLPRYLLYSNHHFAEITVTADLILYWPFTMAKSRFANILIAKRTNYNPSAVIGLSKEHYGYPSHAHQMNLVHARDTAQYPQNNYSRGYTLLNRNSYLHGFQ